MKKIFRFILLLLVAFAIYAGLVSQEWSYPIGITAFSFLCFLGTLNRKRTAKLSKASNSSSAVLGASITNSFSAGSDCGGSDGGC